MSVYFPSFLWLHFPELKRMWVNILWQLHTLHELRVDLSVPFFLPANSFLFITQEGKPGGSIL